MGTLIFFVLVGCVIDLILSSKPSKRPSKKFGDGLLSDVDTENLSDPSNLK